MKTSENEITRAFVKDCFLTRVVVEDRVKVEAFAGHLQLLFLVVIINWKHALFAVALAQLSANQWSNSHCDGHRTRSVILKIGKEAVWVRSCILIKIYIFFVVFYRNEIVSQVLNHKKA